MFILARRGGGTTSARDVLARATAADQTWVDALSRGDLVHVSADTYAHSVIPPKPGDPPSELPESYVADLSARYDGDALAVYCVSSSVDGHVLRQTRFDATAREFTITVLATGVTDRNSSPGISMEELRKTLTKTRDGIAGMLSTAAVREHDVSLGRSATVITIAAPSGTADPVFGTVEKRLYFDPDSGLQFGEETWQIQPDSIRVLIQRVTRTFEVDGSAPACDGAATRAGARQALAIRIIVTLR